MKNSPSVSQLTFLPEAMRDVLYPCVNGIGSGSIYTLCRSGLIIYNVGDNGGGLSFGCHSASPPALDGPVCLCELYRHSVCFILVCAPLC